ncbi:bolA-like protein 3 [Mytilus californianus]|uniref:bolA-like protein 3 n=1 Tax=Mytilus californianus TaxID=6549 RepID=UPI002245F739|nr:bolA-like protein 3 [Mytilus californianus]
MFRYFRLTQLTALCRSTLRQRCTDASTLTEGELKIVNVLKEKFPKASDIQALDISGGCGSMYKVYVESVEFSGQRTLNQHRMVKEALKEEIKDMHGLNVVTKVPS